jgi:hypothetical protein
MSLYLYHMPSAKRRINKDSKKKKKSRLAGVSALGLNEGAFSSPSGGAVGEEAT